jgi:SAM-dependent methyltransferase
VSQAGIDDHYTNVYGRFATELYAEIRREAFGEDIGQNNWSTVEEHRRFLGLLQLTSSDSLLDVCCGSGGPTIYMARERGCRALGIDSIAPAVAHAWELAQRMQVTERVEFAQIDADETLPFSEATFDAVICLDAINHLADRGRVLADWARILKPTGRLLFTDCVTVTGLISNVEIAARSRIGHYVFSPVGENERLICDAGLELRSIEDVTENLAALSGRRWRARAARAEALRRVEGESTYAAHQEVLATAERLALEGRLSRFVYVAVKPMT